MEKLVHQLADMCSLRDRYALDDAMVRLVYLTGTDKVAAVRMLRLVGDADDLRCLTRAEFDGTTTGARRVAAWKDWRDLPQLSGYSHRLGVRERNTTVTVQSTPCITAVPVGEVLPVVSLLEIESAMPLPPELVRILEGIARIYANYESLLDYGADEEVAHRHASVQVGVWILFVRQLDVAPDRASADILGAPIGGFHDARAAAGENREPKLRQSGAQLASELIVRVVLGKPGRAEHRDAWPDKVQHAKAPQKVLHHPEQRLQLVRPRTRPLQ